MKVGFHSPLPPARTGVADYSAALLPALRKRGGVELAPRHADIHLYHLANNAIHREIYTRALTAPGVIVLHDALLQHMFMSTLDESGYIEEFTYNYGVWTKHLAQDLWRKRAGSGLRAAYYDYPMLKRIAERSLAVVVHNPAAADIVRRHAPHTPVIEIPHLYCRQAASDMPAVLRLRHRLGIPALAFVYGIFGYLRESKRVMAALRAFRKVHAARPETALLIAGDFVSADLSRSIVPFLNQPGVFRAGHMTERELQLLTATADACINLRYPAAGETSGIGIRFMGAGKPVFYTTGGEVSRYPENACLRIDHGPLEEEMLAQFMICLRMLPGAAREIGRRGAEHIGAFHAVERVARLYWETLCVYSHCF